MKAPCSFQLIKVLYSCRSGGTLALASWSVRSTPDQAVRVRALAGGHCVVFLGQKTLNSHRASLHTGV